MGSHFLNANSTSRSSGGNPILELCNIQASLDPKLMLNETAKTLFIENCVRGSGTENTTGRSTNNNAATTDTVKIVAYCILAAVCIFGNMLVFVVIIGNRAMRRSMTNIFIMNLAVADFFVGIFCVLQVFTENQYFKNTSFFSGINPTLCQSQQVLQVTMLAASVGVLLLISVDRYTAIIYPLKQKSSRRRQWYFVLSAACWLFSVGYSLPNITFYKFDNGTNICQQPSKMKDYFFIYYCTTLVLLFILPFLIMTFLYGRVCIKLLGSISQFQEQQHREESAHRVHSIDRAPKSRAKNDNETAFTINNEQFKKSVSNKTANAIANNNRESGRKKIVLMFVIIVTSFLLCKLPKTIYVLLLLTKPNDLIGVNNFYLDIVIVVIYLIYLLPSATNPIIYFSFSAPFRQSAAKLFTCHKEPAASSHSVATTMSTVRNRRTYNTSR